MFPPLARSSRTTARTALTVSGNEITDAVRVAATSGDGLATPSGYGVWPAATNKVTNGGATTNTTGWSTGGIYTIARSTEQAKFGSSSFKLTCTGNDAGSRASGIFNVTLTAANHSTGVWIYIPSSNTATVITAALSAYTGATGTLSANADVTKKDQWQWVSFGPSLIAAGDLAGSFEIDVTNNTSGQFFYLDGVQIEANTVSTPYIETDGGTASRSAARVQLPTSGLFTATQGWFAANVYFPFANTAPSTGNSSVFQWGDGATDELHLIYDHSNNRWDFDRLVGGVGAPARAADTWAAGSNVTVVIKWTSTTVQVSFDGGAYTSAANTSIPTITNTTADIGTEDGSAEWLDGNLRWIAVGNGTPNDAETRAMATNVLPSLDQLPAHTTGVWDCRTAVFEKVL